MTIAVALAGVRLWTFLPTKQSGAREMVPPERREAPGVFFAVRNTRPGGSGPAKAKRNSARRIADGVDDSVPSLHFVMPSAFATGRNLDAALSSDKRSSVLIPKFGSLCSSLVCELRNRRTLATY